jgi:transcriptional regulator with XRE-family HTH domain
MKDHRKRPRTKPRTFREAYPKLLPLGRYLAQHRKNLTLKQAEVAKSVGVSVAYISAVELANRTPPTERILRKWAEAIGIKDPSELLTLAGYLPQALVDHTIHNPKMMGEIFKGLGSLSKKELQLISNLINLQFSPTHNSDQMYQISFRERVS